jgi:hypothetical protein
MPTMNARIGRRTLYGVAVALLGLTAAVLPATANAAGPDIGSPSAETAGLTLEPTLEPAPTCEPPPPTTTPGLPGEPGDVGDLALVADCGSGGSCDDKYVCMWEDNDYEGDKWVNYREGTSPGDRVEIDGWDGDNEISSVKNNTKLYVVMYADDEFRGRIQCIAPESSSPNLRQSNGFDNEAESFILKTKCE